MSEPKRPKESPARTPPLGNEWEADEFDDATVKVGLDELERLATYEERAPDHETVRAHDPTADSIDSLLASNEERNLPPPPSGAPPPGPVPPPPGALSPSAGRRLPLPKPMAAPPSPPIAPADRPAAVGAQPPADLSRSGGAPAGEFDPPIHSESKEDPSSMNAAEPPNMPPDLVQPSRGIDLPKLILILGVTLPLAAGGGIWLGAALFADKNASAAISSATASAKAPKPPPSAKKPLTLVERAAKGDFKALDKLKEKPPRERTSEETIALARGRTINKQLALEGFASEIKKNPDLLKEEKQLERLKEFINDRETTNQAMDLVVELPGQLGPDLLYEIWTGTRGRTETTVLAEELVYSKDVKEKASPALKVALDLRIAQEAEDCEKVLPIIQSANDHGDRRSLHLLGKLMRKRGCGPRGLDDCYACLRPLDDDEDKASVVDAIRAVRTRRGPKL